MPERLKRAGGKTSPRTGSSQGSSDAAISEAIIGATVHNVTSPFLLGAYSQPLRFGGVEIFPRIRGISSTPRNTPPILRDGKGEIRKRWRREKDSKLRR